MQYLFKFSLHKKEKNTAFNLIKNDFKFIIVTMEIIEFDNVIFSYSDSQTPAVNGVSFSVKEGETVAIIGHNGSGKSTLAKLCNGLLTPDSGKVSVYGIDTADEKRVFGVRSKVGVVFQNPDNQMVATIIEDDVAFGPENLALPRDEIRQRVDWALDCVGMKQYAKREPFKLSGGQKQRIAIAGVLAIKPSVMILDESTSMLDPVARKEINDVVFSLVKEEKMTLITITHFVEEAMLADKIIVMNEGKIYMQGGKEIFLRQAELEEIGLEVPLSVKISNELKKSGLDIDTALTETELIESLCR